jgi:hypothetical protein
LRFIRPEASKLKAASQGAKGSAIYDVRQPEWRDMQFGGGMPELLSAMGAWPSRRLLTQLQLGSCRAAAVSTVGTTCSSSARGWSTHPDTAAALQLGAGDGEQGHAVVHALLQPVARWCEQHISAVGVSMASMEGVALDGHSSRTSRSGACGIAAPSAASVLQLLGPPGAWVEASAALRVWSHGACEPLRCDMSDQLLVQVRAGCGACAVGCQTLSAFKGQHAYGSSSCFAIGFTAQVAALESLPPTLSTCGYACILFLHPRWQATREQCCVLRGRACEAWRPSHPTTLTTATARPQ